QISHAQKILVIDQEFFQAGPGHVDEFDLHFLGGARSFATLGDVLFSGAGGLYHLINSAVATFEKPLAKMKRQVINHFRPFWYFDLFRILVPMQLTDIFDLSLKGRASAEALEYDCADGSVATITFGELDARSDRIARLITSRGLARGDRLCFFMPNRVEFIDLF